MSNGIVDRVRMKQCAELGYREFSQSKNIIPLKISICKYKTMKLPDKQKQSIRCSSPIQPLDFKVLGHLILIFNIELPRG